MTIKVFRSDQMDAPIISGAPGSLIPALDAILVNGYGQTNVTTATRVGNTATIDTDAPHGFNTGDIALLSGAEQDAYNGEHVVTKTGPTSFTIAVAGEPVTPATGTITVKRAPAGFSKAFAGQDRAAYRSSDQSSRRHFFRVVDAGLTFGGGREAQLWGYEEMTDVDTGSGMFPAAHQYSDGFYWQKSDTADTKGRHWVLITNGKTVYHFAYVQSRSTESYSYDSIGNPGSTMNTVAFGDLVEFRQGDAYASFVTGCSSANSFSSNQPCGLFNSTTSIGSSSSASTSSPLIVMARDFTGVPSPSLGQVYASGLSSTLGYTSYINYPHQIDNGFYMVPGLVAQGSPSILRARMPGFFEPLHGRCFPNGTVFGNVQGYVGRKFMMLYGKHSNSSCSCIIDITGPWEE